MDKEGYSYKEAKKIVNRHNKWDEEKGESKVDK